jgi:hypothetical protein
MAKALATQAGLNFIAVKGPEVLAHTISCVFVIADEKIYFSLVGNTLIAIL